MDISTAAIDRMKLTAVRPVSHCFCTILNIYEYYIRCALMVLNCLECEPDYVPCDDSLCIHSSRWCDDNIDCVDESDERPLCFLCKTMLTREQLNTDRSDLRVRVWCLQTTVCLASSRAMVDASTRADDATAKSTAQRRTSMNWKPALQVREFQSKKTVS